MFSSKKAPKIIEETPNPSLTNEQREEMITYAIKLGKEADYNPVGMIEFTVDKKVRVIFLR